MPSAGRLVAVAMVWSSLTGLGASGVSPEVPTVAASPNRVGAPGDVPSENAIGAIQAQVAELRRKVDKPPKDNWDKLTAASGLVSGLTVALIGFYATNVYNRGQRQSEERRKDQELLISQIQTVEKFVPYLSSKEENVKSGALIAISALGNADLAVKLATAFGGSGATTALTSIASTGGSQEAKSAERALQDVLQYLEARVVTIHAHNHRLLGNGFIIAAHGLIVTADFLVDMQSDLAVALTDGTLVAAEILNVDKSRGLALLKVTAHVLLTPMDLTPSKWSTGDRVIALLNGEHGKRRIDIGKIVGVRAGSTSERQRLILFLNRVAYGAVAFGSPVLDSEGRLLGLIYATALKAVVGRHERTVVADAIPAAEIMSFIDDERVTMHKS